ncbi:response regulator [Cellulophaga sp. L1A9]|uniref:response regulator n=1 Tax=Cellulophaga sp. L1A9 TaxID=2686362 RepID=UPI00131B1FCD|nr:response regulator [Cellulophaga sp. L1A9]
MILEILLVDDDPIGQYLHNSMLNKCDVSGQKMFENGALALKYIMEKKDQEILFLIFLDINMPVMNGWELLEALNKTPSKAAFKVVILTSSIDYSDREKADQHAQVFKFVEKPLTIACVEDIKANADLASFF